MVHDGACHAADIGARIFRKGEKMIPKKVGLLTLVVGLCGVVFGSAAPALATPTVSITPVLGGLAAPRGIAFGGQGSMYVAQSGVAGSGAAGLTHTGLVSKYLWGQTAPAWSVGFNSLYATEDPSAPPDVLGPEGISAL